MARYIDADKLIESLQVDFDNQGIKSDEMALRGETELSVKYNHGQYCYLNAIERVKDAPAADVVPKSEAEKLAVIGYRKQSVGGEYIKRDDVLKALTDDGKDGPPYEVIPQVLAAARRKVRQIPAADVVPKSETASEIIDEIIDALQGEKDQEEKLGSNAWGESDTVGWHIHQYAEEKLDTLIIALSLYKREYTQEQNIGKTTTVPKYKYTGN